MKIDKSKIKISKVDQSDISEMVNYRIDYLTEMQGSRDSKFIEQLKFDMFDYFKKSIANGSFIGLVATHAKTIVAYGGLVIRQIPGDFNCSAYLEGDILNIYTIPEARRQGVSKMVLMELIQEAKSLGLTKLALHTSLDGEKLYRSLGFQNPIYPYLELLLD
jgi:ribosomal protein S18 acetylase RimI-like enzyme